ncbi:MAG TPA: HDIG domain-containing protein, partial [Euryarchaeota archaeon]|nr:HDIG domain-containing protein [Euryarchaeota archaeon]
MKIKELFPYIEKISDKDLEDKVEKAIKYALKEWNEKEIKDIPFTLLTETDINLIDHTNTVTELSYNAGKVMKERGFRINMDYLVAGAILHDIGKFLEFEKRGDKTVKSSFGKLVRHPVSGAGIAMMFDLPMGVINIIAAHSKEGDFVK